MSDRETRIDQAIAEFLDAAQAGRPVDREAWLARHAELRPDLESFLADKAAFDRRADELGTVDLPPGDPDETGTITPDAGPAPPPAVVRYFGDYELLGEVARGGMGVVFRARQVSLNRPVAVKMILSGQLASAQDKARFKSEAEAAANLDHPHILPIYEVGDHEGQHYFSMKLVTGGSLGGRVAALVRDPKAAVALLVKVCRAVHFAHQRGILHRDLKPANILLDADGTPYVTDFGLAKRTEGDAGLTHSGAFVGTPSYAAPEQARAEKLLTTAADVYALGAILYELLTGRPPFRAATTLDTLLQVLEREPDRPRALNPAADRDLETIALKCLAKEPAGRYESAAALADDLDRWQRGEPIRARRTGLPERVWKWVKRRPAVAALTGTAAALVLLVAFGAPLIAEREAKLRQHVSVKAKQAETARGERDEEELKALRSTVEANLRQAQAIRTGEQKGRPTEATRLLAAAAGLRSPMRELADRIGPDAVREADSFWLTGQGQLNDEAAVWLTESMLLPAGSIRLQAARDSPPDPGARVVTKSPNENSAPAARALSRDGRWLARYRAPTGDADGHQVEIIETETGTVRGTIDLTAPPPADVRARVIRGDVTPAFTPEGRLLVAYRERTFAAAPQARHLLVVESRGVPGGESQGRVEIDLTAALPGPPPPPNIFPRPRPESFAEGFVSPHIAFSPDGARVLIYQPKRPNAPMSFGRPRPAAVFDTATGGLQAKVNDPTFVAFGATPACDKLIGAREGRNQPLFQPPATWEVLDVATGKVERTLQVGVGHGWLDRPGVSRDGRWLALAAGRQFGGDGRVVLHALTEARSETGTLPAEPPMPFDFQNRDRSGPVCAVSPDNRLLAVATPRNLHLLTIPDLKVLHSRPHGLNADAEPGRANAGAMQPLALSFLADGRLAAGFQQQRSWGPPGEEVWQFWDVSTAALPPGTPYRLHQGAVGRIRPYPDGSLAVVAAHGTGSFGGVDFGREQRGTFAGPRGAEPMVSLSGPWGRNAESGPRWAKRDWSPGGLHQTDPAAEEEVADFDARGRWFVQALGFHPSRRGAGVAVWDAAAGAIHRSFPAARVLARSRDGRLLALRDEDQRPVEPPAVDVARTMGFGVGGVLAVAARLAADQVHVGHPVRVWDLEVDREVCRFDPVAWAERYAFKFTPDGRHLIGGGGNSTVVGRVADGRSIGPLAGSVDLHRYPPTDATGTLLRLSGSQTDQRRPVCQIADTETGQVRHTFPVAADGAFGLEPVALSPDGRRAATVTLAPPKQETYQLLLWSADGGARPTADLPFRRDFNRPPELAFGPDGRLVVAGLVRDEADKSPDRINGWMVLELWDADTGKRLTTSRESAGSLAGFRLCPASGAVALWFKPSETQGETLRTEVWDLATGRLRASFPDTAVGGATPDGKYLVLTTKGNAVQVVDATTGKVHLTPDGLLPPRFAGYADVAPFLFSPDGSILRLWQPPGESVLWHLADKRRVAVPLGEGVPTWASPDGRRLVSEDRQTGVLTVWDTADGKQLTTIDPRGPHTLPNRTVGPGAAVRISPDGKSVAVNVRGQVRLFDLATGRRTAALPRAGHAGAVNAVAVSSDSRWVASAGSDRTVGLWSAADGRFVAVFDGLGAVRAVEFTPDGRHLLARDEQGHLALWTLAPPAVADADPGVTLAWQRDGSKPGAAAPRPAAPGRPAGRRPVTRGPVEKAVMAEPVRVGDDAGPRPGADGTAMAIRPDGRQLALGNADGTVTLARLTDGEPERTLADAGAGPIFTVAYRGDGTLLAAAGADGTIRLWDVAAGQKVAAWPAGQGEVRAVAFQPGGDLLATAGADARLWRTNPPQLLLHVARPEKPLSDLSFSRDGRWLLTAGEDGTARRHDLAALREALAKMGLGW